jgi:pentatricopeptide repeat domain-containing protein 1
MSALLWAAAACLCPPRRAPASLPDSPLCAPRHAPALVPDGVAIGELTQAVRSKEWRQALTVIEKLEERSAGATLHYNLALQACRRAGQWEPALGLFERMLQRNGLAPPPDASSFTTAVAALSSAPPGSWRVALRLLDRIRADGANMVDDESLRSCFNAAIAALGRGGQWRRAMELLREMQAGDGPQPDAITYNSVLGALSSAGEWRRALGLLQEMERCGGIGRRAVEEHAPSDLDFIGSWSSDPDSERDELGNGRTDGPHASGGPVVAPAPDAISYVSAMIACRQAGRWKQAVSLLGRMRRNGVPPNTHAFSAAISACASAGEWVSAISLLDTMETSGLPHSAMAYSATIAACGRGGAWRRALQLLQAMGHRGIVHRSTHAHNAAISACARAAEWEPAIALLSAMERQDGGAPAPDVYSYNSALSACDRAGQWRVALTLRSRMARMGVAPDAITDNILLSTFARGARWRSALALLRVMDARGQHAAARKQQHTPLTQPQHTSGSQEQQIAASRQPADVGASQSQVLGSPAEPRQRPERHPADAVPLCTAAAACEAAGEWRACLGLVAPLLGIELDAPSPPRLAAAAAAAARAAGGCASLAIVPALGSAVRACARAGELASALGLVAAAHRTLGDGCLPASAYSSARDAAAAAGSLEDTEQRLTHLWRNATGGRDAAGERRLGEAAGGALALGSSESGRARRPTGGQADLAQARFVLEGAQVSCGNGENRSSAADIFLVRGPDGTGMVATVDAAREARALVWRMQRRSSYSPELSALPPRLERRSVSPTRGRMLLSQHAEKKALATQLALGYSEPSVAFNKRMCLDCHELFKAVSKSWRTPNGSHVTIRCRDAARVHVFSGGSCSCGDVGFVRRAEPGAEAVEAAPADSSRRRGSRAS